MTDRRPRFARAASPTLVLTERDSEIIQACWSHRWLTREQLQSLIDLPGVTRTNARLRRLYDHGYLDRLRLMTVGAGLQPIYLAGDASVPQLAAVTETPAPQIRERLREDHRVSPILFNHELAVNSVRIVMTQAIRRAAGLTLERWLHSQECHDAYSACHSVRPDGYFQMWDGSAMASFFLEVDRGTVSLPRWQDKVARYVDYRESGAYGSRYGLTRFRVLTTTMTEARLIHLRQAAKAVTERSFWFALTGELCKDADPRRSIWRTLGVDELRSLVGQPGVG